MPIVEKTVDPNRLTAGLLLSVLTSTVVYWPPELWELTRFTIVYIWSYLRLECSSPIESRRSVNLESGIRFYIQFDWTWSPAIQKSLHSLPVSSGGNWGAALDDLIWNVSLLVGRKSSWAAWALDHWASRVLCVSKAWLPERAKNGNWICVSTASSELQSRGEAECLPPPPQLSLRTTSGEEGFFEECWDIFLADFNRNQCVNMHLS